MDPLSLAAAGASIVSFVGQGSIDLIYRKYEVSGIWEVRLDEDQRIGAFVTLFADVETAWITQPIVLVYRD